MVIKAVFLFLAFIAVLAMFGRLQLLLPRSARQGRCSGCGRFVIGKGPCSCGGRKD